jgi:hypothetical protein
VGSLTFQTSWRICGCSRFHARSTSNPTARCGCRDRASFLSALRPGHDRRILPTSRRGRLFDAVLLGEIAELEAVVASMEKRWLRRCERGIDDENRPPENLVRMRGRVFEAQQLLDALRDRFPSE